MALAKLSIDLEARLANLQAGLDKAGLLAERQAERMQRAFSGANKALVAAGGAIAAAFSVSVITRWVSATVDGLDALNDLADATGASVENLSALEDIAVRTGTSMDTAGDAVIKLNKALADAKPDNEIGAAFKALNLDVAELKRLDPVEAFQRVVIALGGFADDANKARLTQELFGKSLKEVAPLLKDVAEAGTLQAKVTAEQAAEAEKFNKSIFQVQKNLQDLSRTIAGPLLQATNQLFGLLRGDGPGSLDKLLAVPLQAATIFGANVAFVLKGIGTEIGGIAAQAAAVARLDFAGASRIGQMMREDAKAAREELDRFERRALQLGSVTQASYSNEGRNYTRNLPSLPSSIGGDKSKKTKDTTKFEFSDSLQSMLDRINSGDELKLAKLLDTLEEMKKFTEGGGTLPDSVWANIAEDIAKLDPAATAARKAMELLADTPTGKLEATNKKIEAINQAFASGSITVEQWGEAVRAATGTLDDGMERLNDILAGTPTGKMEALLKQIEFINGQFAAGNIKSAEQWAEAIRVATGTMDSDVKDAAEKGIDAARELGLTFSSAFEDAIVGGAKLSDVLKGLEKDILRIVSRKLVTEPLAGATTDVLGSITKAGSSGGFEGILSEIGSKISGLFGGFFADGGFLPPGKWGMAGERGPEPIFGGRTGLTVQPAGGMTVHQHFAFSAPVSRSTEQQVGAAAARGLQRASSRNN